MGLLDHPLGPAGPASDPHRAAQDLETLVLKQLLAASGAFKGGNAPGGALHADLFADALAEAVSKAGGIGLAAQIERELAPAGPPHAGLPPDPGARSAAAFAGLTAGPVHLTSRFGLRNDPLDGHLARHGGVDLGAPEGTPILAPLPGVVRLAGDRGEGYGQAVEIDHGGGLTTLYGHASEVLVRPGQSVQAGEAIARVGHTGRSTGNHLHFEARISGRPVDPGRVLKVYSTRADE